MLRVSGHREREREQCKKERFYAISSAFSFPSDVRENVRDGYPDISWRDLLLERSLGSDFSFYFPGGSYGFPSSSTKYLRRVNPSKYGCVGASVSILNYKSGPV